MNQEALEAALMRGQELPLDAAVERALASAL
jgi:hypothetical protein